MQIKEALKVLKAAGAIRKGKKDFVEMILHSVFAEGESMAHKTLDEKYTEVWGDFQANWQDPSRKQK